jgi:hypothetical protein
MYLIIISFPGIDSAQSVRSQGGYAKAKSAFGTPSIVTFLGNIFNTPPVLLFSGRSVVS